MADGMDETPENKTSEDEAAQYRVAENGPSGNGAPDQPAFVPADAPPDAAPVVGSSGGKGESGSH